MLATPSTSHVNYERVYEPAEDSYLMLDTLSSSSETGFLRDRFPFHTPSPSVLEVGTGSGIALAFVTAHAEQLFGRADVATIGTDVNRFACAAARETVQLAAKESLSTQLNPGFFMDVLNTDLASNLRPASVDVLIFNPPYVPSEMLPSLPESADDQRAQSAFKHDSNFLALSTDGGQDGMETTNRLLSQLTDEHLSVLSDRGVVYVLLCAQNKPNAVLAQIRAWKGWTAEKVSSSGRKAGWERLCVIRIWRSSWDET